MKGQEKDIANLWRGRRKSRRPGFVFTLNLTPMMDVMFNLLVFFLVSTSFNLPEGLLESRLPQTQGISADPAVAVPVVPVKVFLEPATVRGTTLIRVSSSFRADAASLMLVRNYEELYGLLKEMSHRPGITTDTPLVIAARPSTAWDQVVNAYNAALRARYKNIVFAGWK